MATLYVAISKTAQEWGADVGLTKHIYMIGVAPDGAEAAVAALNAATYAGQGDWKLLKHKALDDAATDEAALRARLAAKEKPLDPDYYPRLKGAKGLFKIKPANVENALLMQQVAAGEQLKPVKVKPADIAAYMIRNAIGALV
jgi:hypothetical protein